MKYDIERLRKIDFKKFDSSGWSADMEDSSQVYLRKNGAMVAFSLNDTFEFSAQPCRSIAFVNEALAQIDRCDAFIVRELAAIEEVERREKTKPPRDLMRIEQIQTVPICPGLTPCVGIRTLLAEQYRGKRFRVIVEELP